jgi:hypothetical protein
MPTNVTVEYALAEQEYNKAGTPEEKMAALKKMLSTVPTHKGTEKLRQEIKTKLAKLKRKQEKERKSKGKSLTIKKEGSATVVLIGPPNSGKSSLLNKLTGAKALVAAYEHTTTKPEVGVLDYKGLKFQVIELPAIIPGFYDSEKGPQFLSVVRNADLVVIVTHTDKINYIIKECKKAGILLNEPFARSQDDTVKHAKAMIVVTKGDLDSSKKSYIALKRFYNFSTIRLSTLNQLKDEIWKHLELVKIYTKEPTKKVKKDVPICLEKDSTIKDMAQFIHKDFIRNFRFARVWGRSAKFPGQQAGLDHKLADDDIVELHMR